MKTYKELYKKTHLLIKHNKSDLTAHDKKTLKDNPNKPFLHITRELGTACFLLDDCSDTEELDQLEEMVNFYIKENPLLILFYDQKGFKSLNIKQAQELFRSYREAQERKARLKELEEEQLVNY